MSKDSASGASASLNQTITEIMDFLARRPGTSTGGEGR